MILFIFLNFIKSDCTPKLIMNVSTKLYCTAISGNLEFTENEQEATPFCMRTGETMNEEMIQVCDNQEMEMAAETHNDQKLGAVDTDDGVDPREYPELSEGEDVVNGDMDGNYLGLTWTVQPSLMGTEKFGGMGIHLEPEHGTPSQNFNIIEVEDSFVRIVQGSLCVSVKVNKKTFLKEQSIPVAILCDPDDIYNRFVFIPQFNQDPEERKIVNEAKLEALVEAARVSSKVREKLGMDYLEIIGAAGTPFSNHGVTCE